jgi:hypothetical protein
MTSPKNAITDWDTNPDNNTDVGGINIAEGCPAANLNNSERTMMAQIASWLIAAAGPLLKSWWRGDGRYYGDADWFNSSRRRGR